MLMYRVTSPIPSACVRRRFICLMRWRKRARNSETHGDHKSIARTSHTRSSTGTAPTPKKQELFVSVCGASVLKPSPATAFAWRLAGGCAGFNGASRKPLSLRWHRQGRSEAGRYPLVCKDNARELCVAPAVLKDNKPGTTQVIKWSQNDSRGYVLRAFLIHLGIKMVANHRRGAAS